MKYLLLFFIALSSIQAEDKNLNEVYFAGLDRLRADYRQALSRRLLEADKVIISIYDPALAKGRFDDPFQEAPEPTEGLPAPKSLNESERKVLLTLLAKQMSDPEETIMMMCHNPIHKLEIYSKDKCIFESTLCWNCQNFSFEYPEGSEYLPTSEALKEIFLKLMPIK
jgi:hypothetical protein